MMESTEIMYVNLKGWLVALDVALGHSLLILAQENTLTPQTNLNTRQSLLILAATEQCDGLPSS